MTNRILVSAVTLLAAVASVKADEVKQKEMVCVVIHQEGFVRNPTPDQLARGMPIPCDEKTDDITALNYYLAHGGH